MGFGCGLTNSSTGPITISRSSCGGAGQAEAAAGCRGGRARQRSGCEAGTAASSGFVVAANSGSTLAGVPSQADTRKRKCSPLASTFWSRRACPAAVRTLPSSAPSGKSMR